MDKNYDQIYSRYKSQVDRLVRPLPGEPGSDLLSRLGMSSQMIYAIFPGLVFILLVILQPSWIMITEQRTEGVELLRSSQRINWSQVVTLSLLIGGLLDVVWYWKMVRG